MGTFTVNVQIGDLDLNGSIGLDTIVDTGSTYTFIPAGVLTQLGIKPEDRRLFELADNRTVEYSIGYARLRLDDNETITVVVFAEDENSPLLGATTLEHLSLGVDPINQRLIPVSAILKYAHFMPRVPKRPDSSTHISGHFKTHAAVARG